MKRWAAVLLAGLILAADTPLPVFAFPDNTSGVQAIPSEMTFIVNGSPIPMQAYLIDGSNYVKCRDIAMALRGTRQKCSASYLDSNTTSRGAYLYKQYGTSTAYQPLGTELQPGDGQTKNAKPTYAFLCSDGYLFHVMWIDSCISQTAAYQIEESTYISIRDVAQMFDFSLKWSGAENAVFIDTENAYLDADYIPPQPSETRTLVGTVYESKRMLFINEMPIPSYDIDLYDDNAGNEAMLYIAAEDLENYGFDVSFNGGSQTLSLHYLEDKPFGMLDGEYINSMRSSEPCANASSSPIHTLLDGKQIGCYDIGGKQLIAYSELYPYGVFSNGLDPDRSGNPIQERINIDFLKYRLQTEVETLAAQERLLKYDHSDISREDSQLILDSGGSYELADNGFATYHYGTSYGNLACNNGRFFGTFQDGKKHGLGLDIYRYYHSYSGYSPSERNKFSRGLYQNGELYDGIQYASATHPAYNNSGSRTEGAFVNGYQRQSVVESPPAVDPSPGTPRFGYRIVCEGEVRNGAFCGYYRHYDDSGKLCFEGQYADYLAQSQS